MTYESTYSKVVSSNSDDKGGLSNSNKQPWSPEAADENPTVTVTVSSVENTDVFVDSMEVQATTNVASITVTSIDADGKEVKLP